MTATANAALPRLVVQQYDSSDNPVGTTTYDDTPSTVNDITLHADAARVNIFVEYTPVPGAEPPEPIGHITFVSGGSLQSQIDFVIGTTDVEFSTAADQVPLEYAMRCATWRGLTAPSTPNC